MSLFKGSFKSFCRVFKKQPQKNPRAHKKKGTPTPPKPSPLKGGILWTWVFPAERTHFQAHNIGAAISGTRIVDKTFYSEKALDTFKFLRHVMRAILSVGPKCSDRCVPLKETRLKPVQILKHTTKKLSRANRYENGMV